MPDALADAPAVSICHTRQEIQQQPAMWRELAQDLQRVQPQLTAWLGAWLSDARHQVLFTGAGSSGFIADMVADTVDVSWPARARAIHTTRLLSHPRQYLRRDRPTLLVSFARSGSSPESVAAVDLLREHVDQVRFLDITCNADGELARRGQGRADTFTLLMPPRSCDRGFAMTSSLTSMLLAALSVFDDAPWPARLQRLRDVATLGEHALARWGDALDDLANTPFARVAYLGSGPLEAAAREAALKLLELSAGRVPAFADTPLGFRHGPKSLLNHHTLVVMLRSAQPLARRYEQDLLDELRRDRIAGRVVAVGPQCDDADAGDFTLDVPPLPDPWLAPLWLTLAQRHALLRSIALGLTPDNPFPDGSVNRVVQGVTIHHHG